MTSEGREAECRQVVTHRHVGHIVHPGHAPWIQTTKAGKGRVEPFSDVAGATIKCATFRVMYSGKCDVLRKSDDGDCGGRQLWPSLRGYEISIGLNACRCEHLLLEGIIQGHLKWRVESTRHFFLAPRKSPRTPAFLMVLSRHPTTHHPVNRVPQCLLALCSLFPFFLQDSKSGSLRTNILVNALLENTQTTTERQTSR